MVQNKIVDENARKKEVIREIVGINKKKTKKEKLLINESKVN